MKMNSKIFISKIKSINRYIRLYGESKVKNQKGEGQKYTPKKNRRKRKQAYMLNRVWFCDICKTGMKLYFSR